VQRTEARKEPQGLEEVLLRVHRLILGRFVCTGRRPVPSLWVGKGIE